MSSRTEAAQVGAGGGRWAILRAMSPARAGFGHVLANNYLFAFGGTNNAPSNTTSAAEISTTPRRW